MTRWPGRPFVVLADDDRRRWGGDLRRHFLLRGIVRRTGATVVESWRPPAITRALRDVVGRRREFWRRRPWVVSAALLDQPLLDPVVQYGWPLLLDIHDDILLQSAALGLPLAPDAAAQIRDRSDRNRRAFRWFSAPSRPFADLAGLDLDRVIVASNGTATDIVRSAPWPTAPRVGFVSGAAPGRGIEALIDALRKVRGSVPDAGLDLWLAATGDASLAYLEELRSATAVDGWITIGQATYPELGAALGRSTVLVIPTPANPYWDSVAPVKLFDMLAAGRPIVSTPRAETARILTAGDAGIVAAGDDPDALASAILPVLTEPALARRLGEQARRLAVSEFDWAIIADRLADELLQRRPRLVRPGPRRE